ncbi:pyridoxal-phosphate dependent enzyme [Bosea caraganae]|uniref:Pyridoxal-phosphate dependent enzyme n=1 Tax=Bosea caraganae TaxID=2763117 RepID=A0A370KZ54_9HYPH|nr:pyridoxal-phosphate dependent enzyme [Bosea caraganae]RDJ20257.1 pyridoxal-phosphate dependent enzyme [Bosea caraganae]RDJ23954.1 pyridoxal-phosphate dependent enzyme [Bosea caraganae]
MLSAEVEPVATIARGIGSNRNGYRAVSALRDASGLTVTVSDLDILDARQTLARAGIWAEAASCAGLVACRRYARSGKITDGPVVHISTSSGQKGATSSGVAIALPEAADWASLRSRLARHHGLKIDGARSANWKTTP